MEKGGREGGEKEGGEEGGINKGIKEGEREREREINFACVNKESSACFSSAWGFFPRAINVFELIFPHGEVPGCSAVRTEWLHCQGTGSIPSRGTKIK